MAMGMAHGAVVETDALERRQRGAAVERARALASGALAGAREVVHPELAGDTGEALERGRRRDLGFE